LTSGQKGRLKVKLLELWEEEKDVALYNFAEFLTNETLNFLELITPASRAVPIPSLNLSFSESDGRERARITDAIFDHDRKMIQREFNASAFDCGVCFENKRGTECFQFGAFKHTFCKECLKDYFTVLITDGLVNLVGCPDPSCKKVQKSCTIPAPDLVTIVGTTLSTRCAALLHKQHLESRTDVAYCPRPACQTPIIRDSIDEKLTICPKCRFAFCYFCNRVWHGNAEACRSDALYKIADEWIAADEAERRVLEMRYGKKTLTKLVKEIEEERESLEWMKSNTTPCPVCCVGVEKIDGCNHITCHMCQTHFCYLCGAFLDKRRPYQHFNDPQSTCFNQLFAGINTDEFNPDWI